MFEGKSLWAIIQAGGWTMYALVACSVIALAVFIERLLALRASSRFDRGLFMENLAVLLGNGDLAGAAALCDSTGAPAARIATAGLNLAGTGREKIANAMERRIEIEAGELERLLPVLGTIGSTVVYVGLFGTVLGIIRSFRDIAGAAAGSMSTVVGGISEALVCTATGILIAVPSVIAFNYLSTRVSSIVREMELIASETGDLLDRE